MNHNYDEIDNLLFEYFENNSKVPDVITNGIETAMPSYKNKNDIISLIKKIIITIVSILTVTGGVVFAKEIKILLDDLLENIFGNYNNGVTTAIENGYIQDIDMEYMESNHIKVKVDQISMDSYNLGIVFNVEFNENDYLNDVFDFKFADFSMIDENNNVIFAEYENLNDFAKYCEENNLDKGVYGIGYANCGWNGKILNRQGNNIIYSFCTISESFPISKKLNIKFDKIILFNNKVEEMLTLTGNWEMNIDIEEMQKERKSIEYTVTNINDNKTTVEKATLSMSNMRLELITSSNKIDFKKLQNRDREHFNVMEMIPFHEMYIETENGEKFFESNSGNNGYQSLENKKIRYYTNFDYTYFDKSETIKIVLPTNKKENLVIEMKASNYET